MSKEVEVEEKMQRGQNQRGVDSEPPAAEGARKPES